MLCGTVLSGTPDIRNWETLNSFIFVRLPGLNTQQKWIAVKTTAENFMISISRVPDQKGASQAWYIVEIHHSGREPSICSSSWLSANVCVAKFQIMFSVGWGEGEGMKDRRRNLSTVLGCECNMTSCSYCWKRGDWEEDVRNVIGLAYFWYIHNHSAAI